MKNSDLEAPLFEKEHEDIEELSYSFTTHRNRQKKADRGLKKKKRHYREDE